MHQLSNSLLIRPDHGKCRAVTLSCPLRTLFHMLYPFKGEFQGSAGRKQGKMDEVSCHQTRPSPLVSQENHLTFTPPLSLFLPDLYLVSSDLNTESQDLYLKPSNILLDASYHIPKL